MNRFIAALPAICIGWLVSTGALADPLKGAIFTTVPDGTVVNANVQYIDKREVYLDGGPPPNAPQTAAGLPDGLYIFQITNPSGWVQLSEDPAQCRVARVADGIIVELVAPSAIPAEYGGPYMDTYIIPGRGRDGDQIVPCHIQNDPDGAAGENGRHDTNTDTDYGDNGAIVIQMMPFLDTPNPGGVYKAWITPIATYADRGGDLTELPAARGTVKKRGQVEGFKNDPGYGPPRSIQKTDNFKVKEIPPRLIVRKYEDLNGNGQWDDGEPEIPGWEITVTDHPLYDDSTVNNTCFTECDLAFAPGSTLTVTEELKDGYQFSWVTIDGVPAPAQSPTVTVTFAPGDLEKIIEFGNYRPVDKSGAKYKDRNGNGMWDSGEEGLKDWSIRLYGTTGMGENLDVTVMTGADGSYKFADVPPGIYTVREICPTASDTWYQSQPFSLNYECGDGVYEETFISGGNYTGNDFGNFQEAKVHVLKYLDMNQDGRRQDGEDPLDSIEFCLYADGSLVDRDDFIQEADDACQKTAENGTVEWDQLLPNTYTVMETLDDDYEPTGTVYRINDDPWTGPVYGDAATRITLPFLQACADRGRAELEFGNFPVDCITLSPGYWYNWDNHYTMAEIQDLLNQSALYRQEEWTVDEATEILWNCGRGALICMQRFALAHELTIALSGTSLFKGNDIDLREGCRIPRLETLGYWLDRARFLSANGGSEAEYAEVAEALGRYVDYFHE